jgi:hypothetical protein
MDDDPRAIVALASFEDDRLAEHLLEFIALGTWAGKPFVVPVPLRSPYARMHLRTLFLPDGGINALQAERVLTAALHDSRPALRQTAASILGILGHATAAPALLSLLQHADEQVGNQIFASLVRLGPVAVPALIETSTSSSPWMRWHCIRALGKMRDLRALPMLVRALTDTDHSVAWMAAKGLVPFGKRSVGPVLRLLMPAPVTPCLVETASYVLSHQRDPRLKPYLAPVMRHMHGAGFDVGTILYAQKALLRLIADGLIEAHRGMPM